MRDDRVYLAYIVEVIEAIEHYLAAPTGSLDRQRFFGDDLVRDAVLRRMETLADAASHLSPALQERHPEVPWARISGFRNVLAHAYTHLNLELIWEAIAGGLPALKMLTNEELRRLGGS